MNSSREIIERLESLIDRWTNEQAAYPNHLQGRAAAAAVRCCINELQEVISALPEVEKPGDGDQSAEAGKMIHAPEGWVLVPKEPTREMIRAMDMRSRRDPWPDGKGSDLYILADHERYAAMLSAAPPPPVSTVGGDVERDDVERLVEFADHILAKATSCCTDPDAGPDYSTVVHFTGEEGCEIHKSLRRLLAPFAGRAATEPEPCFECGSTERVGTACARCNPAKGEGEQPLRPEVLAFARLMEAQLRANDHKPGWKQDFANDLFDRIGEEAEELREAIEFHGKQVSWGDMALHMPAAIKRVGEEAADVANFAMMIADVCGALGEKEGE